jgi:hypothetical protein
MSFSSASRFYFEVREKEEVGVSVGEMKLYCNCL